MPHGSGEHPRLDLRDVHRLLLLEDARLHAVVADAVTGAGAHRVVDAHERERAEDVAVATHDVHLADLLFERAPLKGDAERVLLERSGGLRLAHPLRARILVALVAVEAVVDLLLDVPRVHSPIGERERAALAPSRVGADEQLGERGLRAPQVNEVRPVERARLVEGRPGERRVVAVDVTRGEPRFASVEGVSDRGRALLVRRVRLCDRGGDRVGPGAQGVGPVGAARFRRLPGDLVDLQQREHAASNPQLLVARHTVADRSQRLPRDVRRIAVTAVAPRLPRVAPEHALLREVALESPERRAIEDVLTQRPGLALDAEQLHDERAHVGRRDEQSLALRLGRHPLPFAGTVLGEAGVRLGCRAGKPLLELGVEIGEAGRLEQIAEREAGDAERAIRVCGGAGRGRQRARGRARGVHRCSHLLITQRGCQRSRMEVGRARRCAKPCASGEGERELLCARLGPPALGDVDYPRDAVIYHAHGEPGTPRGNDLQGPPRGVVGAREVAEMERGETRADEPGGEVGRLLVGEVAEAAGDALLQVTGVWAVGEHPGAVVRFEKSRVARAQERGERRRDVAEVGGDAEPFVVARREGQRDLWRVVRDMHRADLEASGSERRARGVLADLPPRPNAARGDAGVEEEGDAERAGERLGVGEVIAVVMRKKDGVDPTREQIGAEEPQALGEHTRTQAGIDEDARAVVRLEQQGVARRATAEDERAQASFTLIARSAGAKGKRR
jgi:hypothetical protein